MSVSDQSDGSSAGKLKPRRTDWLAIRQQYESGDMGQRKLAAFLGISPNTLMQRAMREKWRKRSALVKMAADEIEAEIDTRVKKKVQDELAPWIEKQKTRFTKRSFKLATRGFKRVETMMDDDALPTADDEAKIARAAETYNKIGRVALGMSDGTSVVSPLSVNLLTNQAAVQFVSQV